MPRSRRPTPPADQIFRTRLRESIHFPDLSERRSLKLTALPRYASRAHFGLWMKRFGPMKLDDPDRLYTPLVYIDLESEDVALEPHVSIEVRGRARLSRTVDSQGETRNLAREGEYTFHHDGVMLGRVRMVNFFTRNDPKPERRRVTKFPPSMGLGECPTRLLEAPTLDDLVPGGRPADFADAVARRWHYGQTDPNRHVNGVEYVRNLEEFVAVELGRHGEDLREAHLRRAQIVYRKPCFRGEGYLRRGWWQGAPPDAASVCIHKEGDAPQSRPAVGIEFEIGRHAPGA